MFTVVFMEDGRPPQIDEKGMTCIVNISSEKRRKRRDGGSLDGRSAAMFSLVMSESYTGLLKCN
jgi:hypothetical protein